MNVFVGLLVTLSCVACSKTEEPAPAARVDSSGVLQSAQAPVASTTVAASSATAAAPSTLGRVRRVAGTILGTELTDKSDDVALSALPKPADELGLVETILALEEEFKIEIPDDALGSSAKLGEVMGRTTIRTLAVIVDQRLRLRGQPAPAEMLAVPSSPP